VVVVVVVVMVVICDIYKPVIRPWVMQSVCMACDLYVGPGGFIMCSLNTEIKSMPETFFSLLM
jgi:hypothetical protein